ncbi:Crossover junction endonuclease eme1 [Neolecta irregularis DAH-3]|uniref:Crossover junction endonuclease eme1 n=1 Tax=Neolecta irregularis (strain DAH-3) TaxID=1198029 RepID=A0A1U7LNS3_NEOID|nr:Crossover junction endonuclease eme1 [Neolecta irregularis DAH-3]|eukprot:OLL24192.1 Crossover junction endonuclease eme1 [Neolecta irregularis DAH-3]
MLKDLYLISTSLFNNSMPVNQVICIDDSPVRQPVKKRRSSGLVVLESDDSCIVDLPDIDDAFRQFEQARITGDPVFPTQTKRKRTLLPRVDVDTVYDNIPPTARFSPTHEFPQDRCIDTHRYIPHITEKSRTTLSHSNENRDILSSVEIIDLDPISKQKKKTKTKTQKEPGRSSRDSTVCKVGTSKKDCTPEMIVDVSTSLATPLPRLCEFLGTIGAQMEAWSSPVENMIKWRRKVKSLVPEIRDEKHVLVYFDAKEFVSLDLESSVCCIKSLFPNAKVLYMIQGLERFIKNIQNARNREYIATVRGAIQNRNGEYMRGASVKKKQTVDFNEEEIQEKVVGLQVFYECLVIHTSSILQSVEWISILTGDIAMIPYKQTHPFASFCMDAGQVKTGKDVNDTFCKSLEQVTRVTRYIATAVMNKYNTPQALYRGFTSTGAEALSDCTVCANMNGAMSNRMVGSALSRRLHQIFTTLDPEAILM